MSPLMGDPPALRRARKAHPCRAPTCTENGEIDPGEVHVALHGSTPRRGRSGQPLTNMKHLHFTAHYHLICFFFMQHNGISPRVATYSLEDFENYDRFHREVAEMLKGTDGVILE